MTVHEAKRTFQDLEAAGLGAHEVICCRQEPGVHSHLPLKRIEVREGCKVRHAAMKTVILEVTCGVR